MHTLSNQADAARSVASTNTEMPLGYIPWAHKILRKEDPASGDLSKAFRIIASGPTRAKRFLTPAKEKLMEMGDFTARERRCFERHLRRFY